MAILKIEVRSFIVDELAFAEDISLKDRFSTRVPIAQTQNGVLVDHTTCSHLKNGSPDCKSPKMNCNYSSKSVTLKDFDKICRTCLGDEKVSPIVDTTVEDQKVLDLLKYSLTIEVPLKDDVLPQNICENCISELYKVYEFKKQCLDNETVLRMLAENPEPENESSDEEYCNITLIEGDSEYKCGSDCDTEKEKSDHKCRDCDHVAPTRDALREHRKNSKHSEYRKYNCEICDKAFTRSKLRQHMRSHTKEKPYQCEICLQKFSMSGNLKRHRMTHTGERPHVCSVCGKGFIQATSLHAHEKVHRAHEHLGPECMGTMRFTCSFCGRGFKRLAPYNAHMEKHSSDLKAVRKIEKQAEQESRDHVCEICARAYKTKHLLKAHRLTHGEKSFLCSDCGKGFVTKAALQSHLKVHTGEKPHTCVICKKSFAHVSSFDSHMLIHSGLKPYTCSYCPKAFTQLSHLTYHLRTHSGERPYTCTYCNKSFALKGNLTVHVRTHTGETPYVCSVCGKGFYDSSSMKKHQRNHKGAWFEQGRGPAAKEDGYCEQGRDQDAYYQQESRVYYERRGQTKEEAWSSNEGRGAS